mgnify:CR=1 FL=1
MPLFFLENTREVMREETLKPSGNAGYKPDRRQKINVRY